MSNNTFRHLRANTVKDLLAPRNYIRNAYASENTATWNVYSNTPQATPVTGTGSSGGSTVIAQVTTANATANSTNDNQWIGQSFTTGLATTILSCTVNMDYVTAGGSPTGSMFVGIYDNTGLGGGPGTLLGTSNATDASTLPNTTPSDIVFTFTSGPALSAATQYFIVVQPTGVTFNGSTVEFHRDSTNPYAGGNATISLDGGSTYTAVPGSDLRFSVTGTGGINVTIARNTTTPLRMEADFLFTKPSGGWQGQGVSSDFTIDLADTGKRLAVQFDYLASANFVTGTTSDIQVFLFDVTNSVLIYPDSPDLLTKSGTYQMGFQTTTSTSYRLIFHIATANTLAYTFEFVNVSVGQSPLLVTSNPNHNYYTGYNAGTTYTVAGAGFHDFTPAGTTTVTQVLNNGIGSVTTAASNLPGITFTPINPNASYRITAELSGFNDINLGATGLRLWDGTNVINDGTYTQNADPVNTAGGVVGFSFNVEGLYSPNINSPVTITLQGQTSAGSFNIIGNDGPGVINWTIEQLTGYDAVASTTNSNLSIAAILANGTNVTSTPTALGQYRTYIQNASAGTGTDNAPASPPTAADGMHIYTANMYTSAGTSGQTNRWEIFIGLGKTFQIETFATTGRSGGGVDIENSAVTYNSTFPTIQYGLFQTYNELNGVLTIDAIIPFPTVVSGAVGKTIPSNGGIFTGVSDLYFDVIVANNQFQIQVNGGDTVGDVQTSLLTEPQFQAFKGPNWILMDGRSVAGSLYNLVTGNSSIPDMRARFQRMKDNGAGLDQYGDLPLGSTEADTFTDHTHNYAVAGVPGGGGEASGGFHGGPNQLTTAGSNNGAGGETQPKAIVVNMFIKIN